MKRFTTSDSLEKKLCFTVNFYVSSPIYLEIIHLICLN